MAVGLDRPGELLPVDGVRLCALHAGIKKNAGVKDMVLLEMAEGTSVAATFTRNKFCAAPVNICRRHLQIQAPRFLLINSGNANAGTGDQGEQSAVACCQAVAAEADVESSQILPFSTGVIGEQLPVDVMTHSVPRLHQGLDENNWLQAAEGIMTTDTLPKAISRSVTIDGETVTITGISKGSGMIKPDMATMLAFIATDARINGQDLQQILNHAVNQSFNAITVDGDTSTNDACVLMATGRSDVSVDGNHVEFIETLLSVFQHLAQAIVRDGEGATKFVEIKVNGAVSEQDAREVAFTVAHSPLVKTALFASDPNWGRILAAVGRAPVTNMQIEKTDLYIGDVCLISQGLPDKGYREAAGQAVFDQQEIVITVNMNLGDFSAVFGIDLDIFV